VLSHDKSGTFLWEGESGSETYACGGRSWTLTFKKPQYFCHGYLNPTPSVYVFLSAYSCKYI